MTKHAFQNVLGQGDKRKKEKKKKNRKTKKDKIAKNDDEDANDELERHLPQALLIGQKKCGTGETDQLIDWVRPNFY